MSFSKGWATIFRCWLIWESTYPSSWGISAAPLLVGSEEFAPAGHFTPRVSARLEHADLPIPHLPPGAPSHCLPQCLAGTTPSPGSPRGGKDLVSPGQGWTEGYIPRKLHLWQSRSGVCGAASPRGTLAPKIWVWLNWTQFLVKIWALYFFPVVYVGREE